MSNFNSISYLFMYKLTLPGVMSFHLVLQLIRLVAYFFMYEGKMSNVICYLLVILFSFLYYFFIFTYNQGQQRKMLKSEIYSAICIRNEISGRFFVTRACQNTQANFSLIYLQ